MRILYNLAVIVAGWLLYIPALFIPRLRSFLRGRKHLFEKLTDWRGKNPGEVIWIHCASLGEFEMARPLIDHPRLVAEVSGVKMTLLVTFFSPSGYDVIRKRGIYHLFYLPLDTAGNARRFVDIVKPREALFIKNEFWFNILNVLQQQKIPTHLINGMIRRDQVFFRRYGSWFRNHLHVFNHFFVQEEVSAELLLSLGIPERKITISGDLRYDRVADIRERGRLIPELENFKTAEFLIIGGSTWPREEELLARFLSDFTNYDCIIAPHEVSQEHLAAIENLMLPFGVQRYSDWDKKSNDFRVLLIDSVGMLSRIYRYGDIAFVGGGFSGGLHNILEPAGFGLQVIYGPQTSRFPEAARFIEEGIGHQISDYDSFREAVRAAQSHLDKETVIRRMSRMQGATQKVLDVLRPGIAG